MEVIVKGSTGFIPYHIAPMLLHHGHTILSEASNIIYNIGDNSPVKLINLIQAIEEELKIEAKKEFLPLQLTDLSGEFNYKLKTSVKEDISQFTGLYKKYFKV